MKNPCPLTPCSEAAACSYCSRGLILPPFPRTDVLSLLITVAMLCAYRLLTLPSEVGSVTQTTTQTWPNSTILSQWLRCYRVWGPKVEPWSHWQSGMIFQQPLAFSVLFSSVASLLGSVGQVNYAAANSALDAAAAADNVKGLCTTSVRWGAWAGMINHLSIYQPSCKGVL